MPKRITPLSDTQVRNAKPKEKEHKLMDGYGLFLLVTPTGGKLWRLDYRFDGKRKTLALGTYPAVSLSDARKRRDEAKALLANDIDPSDANKAKKASRLEAGANSFEVVAREWHTKFAPTWSPSHAVWVLRRLEQYVFPDIGTRPIAELKAPDVLKVLRRIEAVALETAHRVKFVLGQVFRYAVGSGRAERDPTADLKGLLPPRSQKHHAAITDPKEVAGLLRAIDGFNGTFTVKSALQLAPLVFLRPGELRQAEWTEFDLEAGEWNVPIERMKLKLRVKEDRKGEKHLVPLSAQAVAILKDLHGLTGQSRYVFPSARSFARPMSNMALNAALNRMGFKGEMTAHGFRALARTILDEVLQCRIDLVEHQLGHAVRDPNGRAYNRTAHLPERRKMMQTWADYLDGLKAGAKVIPLKRSEG
ncbi:integrase arm-type DNA-binding domain-containing protein [Geomonas sp. Red32]|uniref:tyrosine-type recombinase/integrase n=1 Tax=Geomonas sp. Red32 TaxID=2912856 RepID=UPI00202CDFC8|nr:integrase arm-type DNA-binding domain-containing protein [Geomonas sp. Red32]MCM0083963.1 integrase arm-type DNA-binding domain-containing protein [Geomonas sp. Red32]